MRKISEKHTIIPLLLLNIALTIRATAASYRVTSWAEHGLINKISMTANYLFLASNFILISIIFSLTEIFTNNKKINKASNYLMFIFILIGIIIIGFSMFI